MSHSKETRSMTMDIFSFSSFRELMQQKLQYPGLGRGRQGLDKIAQRLGYRSGSLISMVLNGKRLPSNDLLHALFDEWKLTPKEREYVSLLVQIERKRQNGNDPSVLVKRINRLTGTSSATFLKDQDFSDISEWYFMAIKQLVDIPGFREDPNWISQALRRKVSPKKAEEALKLLESKGLLIREEGTGRLLPAHELTRTADDIPSSAIRAHHRGMLERAAEALEEQSVDRRHFTSATFKGNPGDLPMIKERLAALIKEFFDQYNKEDGVAVYQLNLQFFEHTRTDYRNVTPGSSHEQH